MHRIVAITIIVNNPAISCLGPATSASSGWTWIWFLFRNIDFQQSQDFQKGPPERERRNENPQLIEDCWKGPIRPPRIAEDLQG